MIVAKIDETAKTAEIVKAIKDLGKEAQETEKFLNKQAKEVTDKLNDRKQKLFADLEDELINIGKLPKDYDREANCIGFNDGEETISVNDTAVMAKAHLTKQLSKILPDELLEAVLNKE